MNSVRLYYIEIEPGNDTLSISRELFDLWLQELSAQKRSAIQRLVHGRDQLTSMLGLRLLKQCAIDEGFSDFKLTEVIYPEREKPQWAPQCTVRQGLDENRVFDFNISHTHGLVVVAISKTLKLGIDAEQIRPLKRLSFKMVMREDELAQIKKTPGQFFDLWSKKEAVVKAANTAGLSRMRDVILDDAAGDKTALLDDHLWYVKSMSEEMNLSLGYAIHLATSLPADKVVLRSVLIDDLKH
ncbi:MAG: 4'-phosphopantetheinyl transferase superfamily protein [Proteobacteria bacterium]|nr:4'-phosphopantetheinyl transferase superfamily protein [Pseudomonadota bacterium]